LPLAEIVEQLVDHELHFANDNSIAMLERFLRHEAWMNPAHDHRDTLGAELVGNLVTTVDVTRHCGDSDKVRLQIKIDGLDVLVCQHHFVLIPGNACRHREQPGEWRVERPV
jgi:hypothetical protein